MSLLGGSARTYGNWARPRTPSVGGFNTLGAVVMGVGLVAGIVAGLASGVTAAAVCVLLAALIAVPVSVHTVDGRNGWSVLATWVGFRWARSRRRTRYSPVPGNAALPGLLARSQVHRIEDSTARPAAVLDFDDAARTYSVVFRVSPEGGQLVAAETVDQWVSRWGVFLAKLGEDLHVVAASATVQTEPEPGDTVAAAVAAMVRDDAPEFARQVMHEAAQTAPQAAPRLQAWVSVTWSAIAPGDRLDQDGMLDYLVTRIPGVREDLAGSGAGTPRALDVDELTDLAADGYWPGHAGVPWSDAGPCSADELWDRYEHAGHTSVTWRLARPARDRVTAGALGRLLAGHPDVPIKRVTLTYRPHAAHTVHRVADADRRTAAGFLSGTRGEQKASNELALAAARQADAEVAAGAGLVRFTLLVTATLPTDDATSVRRARAAIKQAASASSVMLSPANGSQASSFAAGLGLGLVLAEAANVPASMREWL